jgi:signal transduction histidine kinase
MSHSESVQRAGPVPMVDWATLADQLPGFLMITSGPDHRVDFSNASLQALIGDRKIIGQPLREALPELVPQGFFALREQAYRTGNPYRGHATPIRLRSGQDEDFQDRYIDFIYQPIKREDGSVSGIITAGYDVSEQKHAEDQTRAMQFEMLQMFRATAMGAMAMVLAHELNQPLSAISNYATAARRLSRDSADPAQIVEALDEIEASARRASEIVRLVRDMMGKGRSQDAKVDLADAVGQAITLGMIDAGRKGISHTTELEPGLLVEADPIQIQQVLLNLLRNAGEAVQGCERREVEIRTLRADDEAEIRISDTGCGLNEEARNRLFEPFVTTKPQGLGLGLSICRGVVERHGGRIWAEDRDGGGTVFCLRLPLLR